MHTSDFTPSQNSTKMLIKRLLNQEINLQGWGEQKKRQQPQNFWSGMANTHVITDLSVLKKKMSAGSGRNWEPAWCALRASQKTQKLATQRTSGTVWKVATIRARRRGRGGMEEINQRTYICMCAKPMDPDTTWWRPERGGGWVEGGKGWGVGDICNSVTTATTNKRNQEEKELDF